MLKFISQPCQLKGKILIVCGISPGNVPTYALDHIITQNKFARIAFLHSQYIEPSVGYLPQNIEGGALGLPAQLYMHGDVLLLQFRSFVKFGRKKDFAKQLSSLVKKHEICDVVVISSLPYQNKQDLQIRSQKKNIYYKLKGKANEKVMLQKCSKLGLVISLEQLKDEDEDEDVVLQSAGLAKSLLKEFQNLLVLMAYNDKQYDRQTGKFIAKQLSLIIDRKQLSSTK